MQLTDDSNEYVHPNQYSPNAVLTDADGDVIQPESDWSQSEWDHSEFYANFDLSAGEYRPVSNTHLRANEHSLQLV